MPHFATFVGHFLKILKLKVQILTICLKNAPFFHFRGAFFENSEVKNPNP